MNTVDTRFNLIPHDVDIVVPISPGLLMPKAESVEKLVLHGSQTVTVAADGQLLLSHTPVSHRGVASAEAYGIGKGKLACAHSSLLPACFANSKN